MTYYNTIHGITGYFRHTLQYIFFQGIEDGQTPSEQEILCLICGEVFYEDWIDCIGALITKSRRWAHMKECHPEWLISAHIRAPIKAGTRGIKYKLHFNKPWKDPESLFCDTKFLKQLLNKDPTPGKECKDIPVYIKT